MATAAGQTVSVTGQTWPPQSWGRANTSSYHNIYYDTQNQHGKQKWTQWSVSSDLIPERFFICSLCLSFDICWDVAFSQRNVAMQHNAMIKQSLWFLMNADKAIDETEWVWLYSMVVSLLNKQIISLMMFHYWFFFIPYKQSFAVHLLFCTFQFQASLAVTFWSLFKVEVGEGLAAAPHQMRQLMNVAVFMCGLRLISQMMQGVMGSGLKRGHRGILPFLQDTGVESVAIRLHLFFLLTVSWHQLHKRTRTLSIYFTSYC